MDPVPLVGNVAQLLYGKLYSVSSIGMALALIHVMEISPIRIS